MLYAWLLIICSSAGSSAQCIPPQVYYTEQTCRRVGNAYLVAKEGFGTARCVQVPRKDVR